MSQLELTDYRPSQLASALEQRFRIFHAQNPAVYQALVRLAREAKARGKRKIGIGMLFEVARWELYLQTTDPEFKLNNSFRAYFAREILRNEPDLAGFFETRELRAA